MDAIETLLNDHRTVESLFKQFEITSDLIEKRAILCTLIKEISVHSVLEEEFIYPLFLSKGLEDGEELNCQHLDEHQQVKNTLDKIDQWVSQLPRDSSIWVFPTGDILLVKSLLEEHIKEEEDVSFPLLKEKISEDELKGLSLTMSMARLIAPTHPHPNAPNKPPLNMVAGMPAAAMDRLFDLANRTFVDPNHHHSAM